MLEKIDDEGNFCPFPGVTVICFTEPSDDNFWREIYNHLMNSPTICKYFAPLPYDSYHMTTISLETSKEVGEENWNNFINEKLEHYKEIQKALAHESPMEVQFDLLSEAGGLTLQVKLSEKQTDKIFEFAKKHNHFEDIPMYFHITLAYQFNSMPTEDYKKILIELKPLENRLKQQKTFKLQRPQLCYFHNMTEFTPWDCEENPFEPPRSRFCLVM